MANSVSNYSASNPSEEQMQAFIRHPAVRARILPYQLLADKLTPSTRWERFAAWISSFFFSSSMPKEGTAGHLRDRLTALGLHAKGSDENLTSEEKIWFKRHKKDGLRDQVFMPGQTAILVRQVADAMEKRLESVQADIPMEERVVQIDDWKAKRRVMANVVSLTNPTLSEQKGQEIGKEIQSLYQRGLDEKIQLVAASALQWALSLGAINKVLPLIGIDSDSLGARVGTMWAMIQATMFTSQHLRENTDFLPVKGTLFGTNMVFLYRCFETIQSFATGVRPLKDVGFFEVIQLSGGVNVLMSYCPWKKVAARVSQAASAVVSAYSVYAGATSTYAGILFVIQRMKEFFSGLDYCPNTNFKESSSPL